MKISQIEAWVLEVADRVVRGHPVEDARVELKRAWVDPDKAARAIAGHANSSFGEPVLWVVGLDESEGAIGVKPEDLSDWWAQVKSCFSELAPDVTPLTVPCRDVVLTALLFDTSRAPFIVKNPVFGRREGGPVQLEVPWRESTAVRSARRADLLRVLVPAQSLPDVEVLAGYAAATNQFSGGKYEREWEVRILVYLVPRSEHRLTIPFHRCRVRMTADPESSVPTSPLSSTFFPARNRPGTSPTSPGPSSAARRRRRSKSCSRPSMTVRSWVST